MCSYFGSPNCCVTSERILTNTDMTKTIKFGKVAANAAAVMGIMSMQATAHEPQLLDPHEITEHQGGAIAGEVHIGWDSLYNSEGRDNLDGSDLLSVSAEIGYEMLVAGVWYGNSPDADYDEFQVGVGLVHSYEWIDVFAGYTHLEFFEDNENDDEVAAGFVLNELPCGFVAEWETYYSFDASSAFSEAVLLRPFEPVEKLTIEPAAGVGINHGYVSDGNRGLNYVALKLGAGYALTESLTLEGFGLYNWAVDQDDSLAGDETLNDFFQGHVGLVWSF